MTEVDLFESRLDSSFNNTSDKIKEHYAQCLKEKEIFNSLQNKKKKIEEQRGKLQTAVGNIKFEHETLLLSIQETSADLEEVSSEISGVEEAVKRLLVEKGKLEMVKEGKVEEAQKKHIALRKALACYKHRLHCYLETDEAKDRDCTIHFFASTRNSISENYYVKLEDYNGEWKVLEMRPEVICKDEMSKSLAESGDIISFLTHTRHLYAEHRKKIKR